MAGKRKLSLLHGLLLCLAFCLQLLQNHAAKLSQPKVLLPYFSETPTSYIINIHDTSGCFTWRSSRVDVATISPQGNSTCPNAVLVTAVSKSASRLTSIVLAENQQTGEVLRCDVIVDSIKAIAIETVTRELYLEDSPERFQITAIDSEGNTFSTLDGVSFEWSLISDTDSGPDFIVDAHNVLRLLTFKDSSYDTPPHIAKLEDKGLQGDTVLVEGVLTGSAYVQAKLKDPAYKTVEPTMVRLIVIANVMLYPPDAYILLFAQLRYRADVSKQGLLREIPLPSQQYHLEVQNKTVCLLDTVTSIVTGEALGSTQVVLKDKNMPPKLLDAFNLPSARVNVVFPGYISFTVHPGKKWILETGREYEISIELYDRDSHKIHSSDNMRILADFSSKFFDVLKSSDNGTYHVIRTRISGHTVIEGHLNYIIKQDGIKYNIVPTIKSTQALDIYDPITVLPDVLAFPWNPEHDKAYTAELQARGGSGEYVWSSSEEAVGSVSVKGVVLTRNKIGVTTISANDVHNSLHSDTMKTHILPPVKMEFKAKYVEAEVGSILELPLAVYGEAAGEQIAFTDCRHMTLSVSTENDAFRHSTADRVQLHEGSCTTVGMYAVKFGHSVVQASYKHGKVDLQARVTIAAFNPLVPVNPVDFTVLALGSSSDLLFASGPLPWILDATHYFETVQTSGKIISNPKLLTSGVNKHKFYTECQELGEQKVTVIVGNKPSATNKFPVTRTASVRVFCKEPAAIQLIPVVPQPVGLPSCPVKLDSGSSIPAQAYLDLPIKVIVTDDQGRIFDNVTSLNFDWSVSNKLIADFQGDMVHDVVTSENGISESNSYNLLTPFNKEGSLIVSVKVNWNLNKKLALDMVKDVQLSPSVVSVFNHLSNKASVDVVAGSGYFQLKHSPHGVAELVYEERNRSVQITPKKDGIVTATVRDLCLATSDLAETIIHVSGVDKIELIVRDKVQLGNQLLAYVRVTDHAGNQLDASHFTLMGLTAELDKDHVTVVLSMPSPESTVAVYVVKGVRLGTDRLVFSADGKGNKPISSNAQNIQVFPPLRLDPRNVTLLVGAVLQVQAFGGPQPQSSIEYVLVGKDESVATVSNSGLVEASAIGDTRLRAVAVGLDSETGERIVYSQDEGEVHVVKLMGVRIYAPLSRLQSNTKMPVYAMGLSEEETPFMFANVFPPLSFTWSITNRDVADLKSVYHLSNIELAEEGRFAEQLHTYREGHATVRLEVKVNQESTGRVQQLQGNRIMKDEMHIQVFDAMKLISPHTFNEEILITPNTEAQLKTNRDGVARMSYSIQGGTSDRSILSVSSNGEITSGSRTGQVNLLVTATEHFGSNQTKLLLVKVKQISYLMLNCQTKINIQSGKQRTAVPVGSVLDFTVSHHDDIGRTFHYTNSELQYRLNRFDLVQVTPGADNGTVLIRSPKLSPHPWGGTAFKVWDRRNPRIMDFININIQYGISSLPAYDVGDVMCFNSDLLTAEGADGIWSSDSPNVLRVDSASGVGSAVSPGMSMVTYSVGLNILTHRQIVINPISALGIENTRMSYISTGNDEIHFPVTINRKTATLCSGVERRNDFYPFWCRIAFVDGDIDLKNIFSAYSQWDAHTGSYECVIKCKSLGNDLATSVSKLETQLSITAVTTGNDLIESNQLKLPFIPPAVLSTKELHLSTSEPVNNIELFASSASIPFLEFETKVGSVLHIMSPQPDGHTYKVGVKLLANQPLSEWEGRECSVIIKDRLSGSVYTIPVDVYVSTDPNTVKLGLAGLVHLVWSRYELLFFLLLCVVVTTLCLLAGYYAVFSSKTQNTTSDASKLFSSSPVSVGSLSLVGDGSPWMRQRNSGGRVALWTSGYEPQDVSQENISLFHKHPSKMSPVH